MSLQLTLASANRNVLIAAAWILCAFSDRGIATPHNTDATDEDAMPFSSFGIEDGGNPSSLFELGPRAQFKRYGAARDQRRHKKSKHFSKERACFSELVALAGVGRNAHFSPQDWHSIFVKMDHGGPRSQEGNWLLSGVEFRSGAPNCDISRFNANDDEEVDYYEWFDVLEKASESCGRCTRISAKALITLEPYAPGVASKASDATDAHQNKVKETVKAPDNTNELETGDSASKKKAKGLDETNEIETGDSASKKKAKEPDETNGLETANSASKKKAKSPDENDGLESESVDPLQKGQKETGKSTAKEPPKKIDEESLETRDPIQSESKGLGTGLGGGSR